MVEADLIKSIINGDKKAIAEIVSEHTAVLLRGAMGQGWPLIEAEELVQETLAAFLGAVHRFEGRSSVRTFLFGILYRKAKERGRKRVRELATDPVDEVFERRFGPMGQWISPPSGPEEAALTQETGKLINECFSTLTPGQRSAFHLKEVDHESSPSICNILGVTDTHLRVLLFRARIKLRECLEQKWGTRG